MQPPVELAHRIARYRQSEQGRRYRDSIPRLSETGRWIDGIWIMGNDYQAVSSLYGAYPPRYVERVRGLCPEYETAGVLHIFSGSMPRGRHVRVDISRDRQPAPDVQADAVNLPFRDGTFGLVMADPPYSAEDAKKYGTSMPDRRLVLRELARVTRAGGVLVWLDTQLPMYRKDMWNWWGAIGIIRSSNHRVRLASFFTRVASDGGRESHGGDNEGADGLC